MKGLGQPFDPAPGRYYKVYYEQNGRTDYLYGTIGFSDDGGVMVTRQKDGMRVFLPKYIKIEEVGAGP